MAEQQDGAIFVGTSVKKENLLLRLANRHGLITGATGTGKTVTLQILAEGFSQCRRAGVLPPTSRATCPASPRWARPRTFLVERAKQIGLDHYDFRGNSR